jgi:hypothetical protein
MEYFIINGLVYLAESQKHAEELYESKLKAQELADKTDYNNYKKLNK